MKKLNLIPLFIFLIFAVSCNEDDTEDIITALNKSAGLEMSATLDGQDVTATVITGKLENNTILIGGVFGGTFPSIVISINKDAVPTTYTYPINPNDTTSARVLYAVNDSTSYILNKGLVILSVHNMEDKIVEGTFQGKLYEVSIEPDADSVEVTNGKFKSSYN